MNEIAPFTIIAPRLDECMRSSTLQHYFLLDQCVYCDMKETVVKAHNDKGPETQLTL